MMKVKVTKALSVILLVAFAMSCFCNASLAADAKEVLTFKVSDDGYAVVADCKESAKGVISVPTKVSIKNKSYKVKYIGDKAFDKCKAVTEIYISEGVTAIGSYAFRNCSSLKELYLPETLVRCEYDAFNGCKDLTIHCYMYTYQYINICSSNTNLTFDIIDPPESNGDSSQDDSILADFGIFGTFVTALKNLVQNILDYFGANDEDFSIEDLPFELPFEIPVENDNPFIDLF